MHSRRPPSLRHKGNRRQHKRKQEEEEDADNPAPASSVISISTARKKRKASLCSPRILLLSVTLLTLALFAKFIVSSASIVQKGLQKEPSIRGGGGELLGDKGIANKKEKVPPMTDEKKEQIEHSSAKRDAENEEIEWKNLVKEQTTKKQVDSKTGN